MRVKSPYESTTMKSAMFALVFIVLQSAVIAQQGVAPDSSTALPVKFRLLAAKWQEAYNSKDARNFVQLYADSAEYISAHVDGYVAHGRAAVIANFQRGMDMGGRVDSIDVQSITTSGDLASVVCRYKALAGGKSVEGRNILVCKRMNGTWLIITHVTVVRD
jgi:ketosteroid isomerase-like protein